MKKWIALLCALLLIPLTACAGNAGSGSSQAVSKDPVADMSLTDIANAILKDAGELPMYEVTELTAENFEFYTFIPYAEGYEGVTADALIGSIAHSVVLVRVPDGTDAVQVAADIESKANPAKWICVEAEKTVVRQRGNTILLVMSSEATTDAIVAGFDAL